MSSSFCFSVILPIYNRPNISQRAILSVLNQSYSHYECIIIEDGSSSLLPDSFIKTILKDKRFQYIKLKKNYGVSYARNKGIEKAKYQKICFLDSDDEWQNNKLQKDYQYLLNNRNTFVHHSDSIWIRKGKEVNLPQKFNNNEGFIFYQSLKHCMLAMSNLVIDKKVFEKSGFFDEKLKSCEDYDLFLKITSLYFVGKINEKTVIRHQNYFGQKFSLTFDEKKKDYQILEIESIQLSNDLKMDQKRIKALQNFILFSKSQNLKYFAKQEIIRRCWILIHGLQKKKNLSAFFLSLYYKILKRKYIK